MTAPPAQLHEPARASRAVMIGVCLIAGGTLLLELLVTRLFSALFYYHYSFFAVSIVMTGLTLGALISAICMRGAVTHELQMRDLAFSALLFALGTAGATLFFWRFSVWGEAHNTNWWKITLLAGAYLPALTAGGYFLASAFSAFRRDIARLYAADLIAAAIAVFAAVWIMRAWQGPVAAFVAALAGAMAAVILVFEKEKRTGGTPVPHLGAGLKVASVVSAVLLAIPVAIAPFRTSPLISIPVTSTSTNLAKVPVMYERWNEHSRILSYGKVEDPIHFLLIDREAATMIAEVPVRAAGAPPQLPEFAAMGSVAAVFHMGRDLDKVAVIGVGGGRDLLFSLSGGATDIDGYELNSIFFRLLENEYYDYSGRLVDWPEINLIHDEGRVGITSSGKQYDLIVASMIDTWAATANGGFVLSESALYTVEAWHEFLGSLSPRGVLSMTRWYVPREPVELQRLVVLAAEALRSGGIEDPARHIVLIANGTHDQLRDADINYHTVATIVVSREPFTEDELSTFRNFVETPGAELVMLYPSLNTEPWITQLLAADSRAQLIADSPYNLAPPHDSNPYFFLMMKPLDFGSLFTGNLEGTRAITYNGVRVLVILTALTIAFALVILVIGIVAFRDKKAHAHQAPLLRIMALYFLAIGFGYILIQLGLLQRLILVLGHPTYAFTVILFSMLISTGFGSALSGRVPQSRFKALWIVVVLGTIALVAAYPAFDIFNHIASRPLRIIACGIPPAAAGFLLGFCMPIGIRIIAPAGENAVQRMWAVNGAAGVAGSCVAAFLGVAGGSWLVVAAGAACYAVMLPTALAALKTARATQ